MFPSTAGNGFGSAEGASGNGSGIAEGASAGRADGASAGSSIPEGVSTGPPDIRQALLAARPGDDPGLSRGVQLAPDDVLTEFHRDNPGTAPPTDPLGVYCLFPPGVDARLDLANPGFPLTERRRSYTIKNLRGFEVRVKLGKRCFEILQSPPPVAGCSNSINRAGTLTVGFGSAKDKAWILVLKVLDQVREQDQRPLALAANSVSRASAGTPEERAPEAPPEPVVSPGASKRRLDHHSPDVKSRRVAKPEPHVSAATAINHVCIGRELVRGNIKLEGRFERGEAEMLCTGDYPLGECSHCPFAVVASAPGSTSEANPSSSSQGPVVATDAATANLSKGDGFLAGEGGGHEATSLEEDLSGGGATTGNSEDESDGPADGASAGSILRRCCTRGHHCLANTGGDHRGNINIVKIDFPCSLGEWEVIVCEASGEIMNTPMLAEAFNLDPQQQAELYQLQRVCPEAIPRYDTSSDDDDDVHHLVRLQPCTDAIQYSYHLQGSRYSGSCCADAMRLWSDPFFMRNVICAWANQCEYGYHERIVDLTIPPRHSFIMEYRFARERQQRRAYRNHCLQNMHHARLIEQRALIDSDGIEQEQRAIRGAAAGPWREAERLIGRAVTGFGRGVYSNDFGPLSSTRALAINVGAAAHASRRDAAAHASRRELMALQQELLGACAAATTAATSSSAPTSAAGAVFRATEAFAKFCEYLRRTLIGVLEDDEDGN